MLISPNNNLIDVNLNCALWTIFNFNDFFKRRFFILTEKKNVNLKGILDNFNDFFYDDIGFNYFLLPLDNFYF